MSGNSTLILRLEGPMQSWGYRSRFRIRDTGLEPTKSGVIGLLCCALGRDRSESSADLAALKMHVRVDRPGRLMTDFQTAGGGVFRGSHEYFATTSIGKKREDPVITEKQYLADASFIVALEGNEPLIARLAESIQNPVWPMSLGRKSCPPTCAIYVGHSGESAEKALLAVPAPNPGRRGPKPKYIWEAEAPDSQTEARNDIPVSWPDRQERIYSLRFIKCEVMEWPS